MSYYERQATVHLDGSPIFKSDQDERNERDVADAIEREWGSQLFSFGRLSPIDWWAERDGRIVGLLELKSRTHNSGTYPTVFLNVRKWLALTIGSVGLGVPAVFVVRFEDEIRWVMVADVDASRMRRGGLSHQVKSRNDVEPVIEVPVEQMDVLGEEVDF